MVDRINTSTTAMRWFVGSICLAAAVRLYLLWQYYCISTDGMLYIRAAKDFFAADIEAGLKSIYPPGYPLLIAAIYPLIGNWELAGQILCLLFGVAILLPLYGMFSALFEEKIALLACYLAALSPFLALYSAHVRSEIPYLFLSAFALYLCLTAILRLAKARFFWGGLVAGFAFLVRSEAIGFLAIVPGVLLLAWLRGRRTSLPWLMHSIGLLSAGFLLFALPYIVYLSIDTGRFGALNRHAGHTLGLNLEKSGMLDSEVIAQFGSAGAVVFSDYVRKHPLRYIKKVAADMLPAIGVFFEALHYSYVPFLLLGFYLVFRDKVCDRQDLLLIVFVWVYVLGFALIYVKRRYSLQAVPISLVWVAAGMWFFWDKLRAALSAQKATLIATAVALIFLGATLPKTLKAVSREKAFVRETGWYLKEQNKTGNLKVAVLDERVTFYAETATVGLTEIDPVKIADYLRTQKADYLAAESKALAKAFPEVAQRPEKFGLVLERTFIGSRKHRMLVFRVT